MNDANKKRMQYRLDFFSHDIFRKLYICILTEVRGRRMSVAVASRVVGTR